MILMFLKKVILKKIFEIYVHKNCMRILKGYLIGTIHISCKILSFLNIFQFVCVCVCVCLIMLYKIVVKIHNLTMQYKYMAI